MITNGLISSKAKSRSWNNFDNCIKIKNELQIKFDKYNDFQKLNQNFKDKFKELREYLQKIEKKNFGERIYYFNSKKKYIKNSEKISKAYYIKEIDNDFSEYEKEYKVYTKEYKFLHSKIEEAIEAMQKDYYLSLNAVKKVLKSCDRTLEKYIRDIKNGEIIDEVIASITDEDYHSNKIQWIANFKKGLKVDSKGF